MRLLPAGEAAVLAEVADDVLPLLAGLTADPPAGVTEVVPGERTLLVAFDPARIGADAVARWIRSAPPVPAPSTAGGEVTIDVRYSGEDLPSVASSLGVPVEAVVEAHTGTGWTVAFGGFVPGFGYLRPAGALPIPLDDVPRRASSRPRVPAGSVALAAGYSGVYPRASPGGWQLIGSTDAVLWDLDRAAGPALLVPGARVRFRAVR